MKALALWITTFATLANANDIASLTTISKTEEESFSKHSTFSISSSFNSDQTTVNQKDSSSKERYASIKPGAFSQFSGEGHTSIRNKDSESSKSDISFKEIDHSDITVDDVINFKSNDQMLIKHNLHSISSVGTQSSKFSNFRDKEKFTATLEAKHRENVKFSSSFNNVLGSEIHQQLSSELFSSNFGTSTDILESNVKLHSGKNKKTDTIFTNEDSSITQESKLNKEEAKSRRPLKFVIHKQKNVFLKNAKSASSSSNFNRHLQKQYQNNDSGGDSIKTTTKSRSASEVITKQLEKSTKQEETDYQKPHVTIIKIKTNRKLEPKLNKSYQKACNQKQRHGTTGTSNLIKELKLSDRTRTKPFTEHKRILKDKYEPGKHISQHGTTGETFATNPKKSKPTPNPLKNINFTNKPRPEHIVKYNQKSVNLPVSSHNPTPVITPIVDVNLDRGVNLKTKRGENTFKNNKRNVESTQLKKNQHLTAIEQNDNDYYHDKQTQQRSQKHESSKSKQLHSINEKATLSETDKSSISDMQQHIRKSKHNLVLKSTPITELNLIQTGQQTRKRDHKQHRGKSKKAVVKSKSKSSTEQFKPGHETKQTTFEKAMIRTGDNNLVTNKRIHHAIINESEKEYYYDKRTQKRAWRHKTKLQLNHSKKPMLSPEIKPVRYKKMCIHDEKHSARVSAETIPSSIKNPTPELNLNHNPKSNPLPKQNPRLKDITPNTARYPTLANKPVVDVYLDADINMRSGKVGTKFNKNNRKITKTTPVDKKIKETFQQITNEQKDEDYYYEKQAQRNIKKHKSTLKTKINIIPDLNAIILLDKQVLEGGDPEEYKSKSERGNHTPKNKGELDNFDKISVSENNKNTHQSDISENHHEYYNDKLTKNRKEKNYFKLKPTHSITPKILERPKQPKTPYNHKLNLEKKRPDKPHPGQEHKPKEKATIGGVKSDEDNKAIKIDNTSIAKEQIQHTAIDKKEEDYHYDKHIQKRVQQHGSNLKPISSSKEKLKPCQHKPHLELKILAEPRLQPGLAGVFESKPKSQSEYIPKRTRTTVDETTNKRHETEKTLRTKKKTQHNLYTEEKDENIHDQRTRKHKQKHGPVLKPISSSKEKPEAIKKPFRHKHNSETKHPAEPKSQLAPLGVTEFKFKRQSEYTPKRTFITGDENTFKGHETEKAFLTKQKTEHTLHKEKNDEFYYDKHIRKHKRKYGPELGHFSPPKEKSDSLKKSWQHKHNSNSKLPVEPKLQPLQGSVPESKPKRQLEYTHKRTITTSDETTDKSHETEKTLLTKKKTQHSLYTEKKYEYYYNEHTQKHKLKHVPEHKSISSPKEKPEPLIKTYQHKHNSKSKHPVEPAPGRITESKPKQNLKNTLKRIYATGDKNADKGYETEPTLLTKKKKQHTLYTEKNDDHYYNQQTQKLIQKHGTGLKPIPSLKEISEPIKKPCQHKHSPKQNRSLESKPKLILLGNVDYKYKTEQTYKPQNLITNRGKSTDKNEATVKINKTSITKKKKHHSLKEKIYNDVIYKKKTQKSSRRNERKETSMPKLEEKHKPFKKSCQHKHYPNENNQFKSRPILKTVLVKKAKPQTEYKPVKSLKISSETHGDDDDITQKYKKSVSKKSTPHTIIKENNNKHYNDKNTIENIHKHGSELKPITPSEENPIPPVKPYQQQPNHNPIIKPRPPPTKSVKTTYKNDETDKITKISVTKKLLKHSAKLKPTHSITPKILELNSEKKRPDKPNPGLIEPKPKPQQEHKTKEKTTIGGLKSNGDNKAIKIDNTSIATKQIHHAAIDKREEDYYYDKHIQKCVRQHGSNLKPISSSKEKLKPCQHKPHLELKILAEPRSQPGLAGVFESKPKSQSEYTPKRTRTTVDETTNKRHETEKTLRTKKKTQHTLYTEEKDENIHDQHTRKYKQKHGPVLKPISSSKEKPEAIKKPFRHKHNSETKHPAEPKSQLAPLGVTEFKFKRQSEYTPKRTFTTGDENTFKGHETEKAFLTKQKTKHTLHKEKNDEFYYDKHIRKHKRKYGPELGHFSPPKEKPDSLKISWQHKHNSNSKLPVEPKLQPLQESVPESKPKRQMEYTHKRTITTSDKTTDKSHETEKTLLTKKKTQHSLYTEKNYEYYYNEHTQKHKLKHGPEHKSISSAKEKPEPLTKTYQHKHNSKSKHPVVPAPGIISKSKPKQNLENTLKRIYATGDKNADKGYETEQTLLTKKKKQHTLYTEKNDDHYYNQQTQKLIRKQGTGLKPSSPKEISEPIKKPCQHKHSPKHDRPLESKPKLILVENVDYKPKTEQSYKPQNLITNRGKPTDKNEELESKSRVEWKLKPKPVGISRLKPKPHHSITEEKEDDHETIYTEKTAVTKKKTQHTIFKEKNNNNYYDKQIEKGIQKQKPKSKPKPYTRRRNEHKVDNAAKREKSSENNKKTRYIISNEKTQDYYNDHDTKKARHESKIPKSKLNNPHQSYIKYGTTTFHNNANYDTLNKIKKKAYHTLIKEKNNDCKFSRRKVTTIESKSNDQLSPRSVPEENDNPSDTQLYGARKPAESKKDKSETVDVKKNTNYKYEIIRTKDGTKFVRTRTAVDGDKNYYHGKRRNIRMLREGEALETTFKLKTLFINDGSGQCYCTCDSVQKPIFFSISRDQILPEPKRNVY